MHTPNTINRYIPFEGNPFQNGPIKYVAPAIDPQIEIFLSCLIGGEDANRAYNESVSLYLKGSLDRVALEKALQDSINRHESLRASFNADGSIVCIHENIPFNLYYKDLSSQGERQQQEFLKRYTTEDANLAFDLIRGPL